MQVLQRVTCFHAARCLLPLPLVLLISLSIVSGAHAAAVTTQHNDAYRTGANSAERLLTLSNVNVDNFGKLFSHAVDDDVYAQPLYVPNVNVPTRGRHNVVYVVTQADSIYAFDADSNRQDNSRPLWHLRLTDDVTVRAIPSAEMGDPALGNLRVPGRVGIMGTPVIDRSTQTLYLVARTKEGADYVQRLHALDIRDGREKFGGPVIIEAAVPGQGDGNVNNSVRFNPAEHNQRAGLALGSNAVYVSWASHNDLGAYHGWVMAFDAQTLVRLGVFNATPDGAQGGIWQSGQAPIVDSTGNVYLATGNGSFNADSGGRNFGQSVVKLAPRTLRVRDWFTPHDWRHLNELDLDLNSAGPMMLPGSNRIAGGGKSGRIYVLDSNSLGHLAATNDARLQDFTAVPGAHLHGGGVYYRSPTWGPLVYFWGEADALKAFRFDGSKLDTTPWLQTSFAAPGGMPGGVLSVSANGAKTGTGIVWANVPVEGDANKRIVPGMLRALDADNLANELWNSQQQPARDALGDLAKFVPPTVANGRVYMATFSKRLVVYGLLAPKAYTRPALQLEKAGRGNGRVVSDPQGIDCGLNCKRKFAFGSTIVLRARPGGTSRFLGWQGACSGRARQCVLRLRGNRRAVAYFAR